MKDDYRRIAPCYDLFIDPFNRSLRPIGFTLFQPDRQTRILEIGCGTGTQLAFYRSRGHRTTGIDLSAAMLQAARGRLDGDTLVCRGDATRLPYPDAAFDLVLATLVLHEMDPAVRSAVMEDMLRVAAPQCRFGIIDYHPQPRHSLKGVIARTIIRGIERAAGCRHYANYRHFIGAGGVPELADRYGMQIERYKRVSGGNIGIYRLHRISMGK
jgi:demethylmenaquinone methyltransferase/2-methoxy-6-polyprenyl-1,4-benzoquinol methylase